MIARASTSAWRRRLFLLALLGVSMFHAFSFSALNLQNPKNALKISLSFARNLLWMTVIHCGCTRLWDSSSQVSSFWSERVSNSPKRSDREEPCSSYRTRRGPLNIKTKTSCHDVVLHGWQGRDPSIWIVLSMVVQCFYVALVLGILDSLQDLRSRESSRPATADAGFQHLDWWHGWHGWQMFWVLKDV